MSDERSIVSTNSEEESSGSGEASTSSDESEGLDASNHPLGYIEAPNWPGETHEPPNAKRLLHWGPMVAISIVAYISAVTTHFVMMWWPLTSIWGFAHYSMFLFWNYVTMINLIKASVVGPGKVPLQWEPMKESQMEKLQFCKVCDGHKVPRSHHCNKCNRCSMKMDHHCPWINNCVGHKNHAWFIGFLTGAVLGCVQAAVIHVMCFYHFIHLNWYLKYGTGDDPIISVTFWSFLALVGAFGFALGVAIGLAVLLVIQLKYVYKNMTGIEEYIDSKAKNRREEDEDEDDEWIYPYNLGWKNNIKQIFCNFKLEPRGNGFWWPVALGCNQFTLTKEQLVQKACKRESARLAVITKDFKGGFFNVCRLGIWMFMCQPWTEDARVKINRGERWVITRATKKWFYGHRKDNEQLKGWLPRQCADLIEGKRGYDDEETKKHK